MNSVDEVKSMMKNKKHSSPKRTSNFAINQQFVFKQLNKILITALLFLATSIFIKLSYTNKMLIYKNLYEDNFKFAQINTLYQKYLGSILPFQNTVKEKAKPVFNEKLTYDKATKYQDGVMLSVSASYPIPILESGIVTFIGQKDGYGSTVIIQQIDGLDVWYGNVKNPNVKIYDYVEKGNLLGETTDNKLYLVFTKEGKGLNYKQYLK